MQFYERAKGAFAVISTGYHDIQCFFNISETALYANIILKKGVISPK